MKGCELRLHHVCQGGFVAMYDIGLDRAERNICCDFVDKLRMGGKPNRLKKVVHITLYKKDE